MKKEKGITMLSLILTVAVLIILAGTSIHFGKGMFEKTKLEELKTNMLLIQAKAREYVEEANFRIGIVSDVEKQQKTSTVRNEIYVQEQGLKETRTIPSYIKDSDGKGYYYFTDATKEKWGLEKLENPEEYLLEFDESNLKVEIYNIEGYDEKYSLTEINGIQK